MIVLWVYLAVVLIGTGCAILFDPVLALRTLLWPGLPTCVYLFYLEFIRTYAKREEMSKERQKLLLNIVYSGKAAYVLQFFATAVIGFCKIFQESPSRDLPHPLMLAAGIFLATFVVQMIRKQAYGEEYRKEMYGLPMLLVRLGRDFVVTSAEGVRSTRNGRSWRFRDEKKEDESIHQEEMEKGVKV